MIGTTGAVIYASSCEDGLKHKSFSARGHAGCMYGAWGGARAAWLLESGLVPKCYGCMLMHSTLGAFFAVAAVLPSLLLLLLLRVSSRWLLLQ
jgi:hypothetical protein